MIRLHSASRVSYGGSMTRPRYLIHIGAHKTGTSYLQDLFQSLAPRFLERGLLVPDRWHRRRRQAGHHQLPIDLARGHTQDLQREFAEVEGAGARDVLISSEGLSGMRPEGVRLLGQLIGGAEVRIVFYCRRWSDLLPSSWQEGIRQGHCRPFSDLVKRVMSRPAEQHLVNFDQRLSAYAEVFGRDRLNIVSFSNVVDARLDIGHHFFDSFLRDYADVVRAASDAGQPRHASMPLWQAETVRGLNILADRFGEQRSSARRVWFHRNQGSLDLGDVRTRMERAVRSVTIDDDHPKLRALHEELFQKWGDRLVEPRGEWGFFAPRKRDVSFVPAERTTAPAMERMILPLYDKYRAASGLPERSD